MIMIFILIYVIVGAVVSYRIYRRFLPSMLKRWEHVRAPEYDSIETVYYEARATSLLFGVFWPVTLLVLLFIRLFNRS